MDNSKTKLSKKELEMVSGGEGFPPGTEDYTDEANIPYSSQGLSGGDNFPPSNQDLDKKKKR